MTTETPAPSAFAVPVRQVALLPDSHFFVRVVPLVRGEGAESVEAQVELAVESLAPFPVGQLYYGFHTRPGVARALIYASYRKRFPSDDSESWASADFVAPAFAALLGAPDPAGATTWVITQAEGLTAVHFADASGVPTDVRIMPLPVDADEATVRSSRGALLRAFPGSRAVVDLPMPVLDPEATTEQALVFRAGEVTSTLPLTTAEALDVRDKGDLSVRRQTRRRDQWLWNGLLGFVGLLVLCGLAELGLIGARMWHQTRATQVIVQAPDVSSIMTKRSLATRIEELSSKRLLPLEMITLISETRPAGNIQLLRMNTDGLYTLRLDAQTPASAQGEIDAFQAALNRLEAVERVDVQGPDIRAGVAAFSLTVTFRPEALKPAES